MSTIDLQTYAIGKPWIAGKVVGIPEPPRLTKESDGDYFDRLERFKDSLIHHLSWHPEFQALENGSGARPVYFVEFVTEQPDDVLVALVAEFVKMALIDVNRPIRQKWSRQ